ncbi:hypothetical protein Taro_036239, partial [Colocasia esculenta]|nr:hypothetical protein [Colocasia esculenta]
IVPSPQETWPSLDLVPLVEEVVEVGCQSIVLVLWHLLLLPRYWGILRPALIPTVMAQDLRPVLERQEPREDDTANYSFTVRVGVPPFSLRRLLFRSWRRIDLLIRFRRQSRDAPHMCYWLAHVAVSYCVAMHRCGGEAPPMNEVSSSSLESTV